MSATITFYGFPTGATAAGAWQDIAARAGFTNLNAVGTSNASHSNLIVPAGSKATFNAEWYINATSWLRLGDRINNTWSTTAGVANRSFKIKYRNTSGGSFTGVTLGIWINNNQTGRTGFCAFDQSNNQFQAARVGTQASATGTFVIGSAWSWTRVGAGTTISLAQGVAGLAGLDNNEFAVVNFRVKYNSNSQAGDVVTGFVTTAYSWT